MIFRRFPYTTLNDINLDWIIKQVKQIAAALQGKQDKPNLPGVAGQVLGLDDNLDPVWVDQSGGGGTTNYNSLSNKPHINGVELAGNKTTADLGISIPTGSLALPQMDGTASAGTNLSRFALEGHVHPTDTSRASVNSLSSYSRPNLLNNWYFAGGGSQQGFGNFPINQKRQTTYSNVEISIDRWKLISGSVTLTSAGIVLNGILRQKLPAAILESTTATALLADGTLITPVFDSTDNTFTITATGQTIVAAKLEIGDTQSLAHLENGVFVVNEIPDYPTELGKCQAYALRINTSTQYGYLGMGYATSSTQLRALINTPCSMVFGYSTISSTGTLVLVPITAVTGAGVAVTQINRMSTTNNALVLQFTVAGGLTLGEAYFIRSDTADGSITIEINFD